MTLLQGGFFFAPRLLYVGGLSRLNTLIEHTLKYSNNAVKCITTILALNLTAIKGDELKIGNFKMGIGIAEKSHKTRRDRWGGNANHKSLF